MNEKIIKEIGEKIEAIAHRNKQEYYTLIGEVMKVDKTKRTVDVMVDGLDYFDVQLQAVEDNKDGMVCFPALSSMVMIERIGESKEFKVSMYSAFEELIIKNEALIIEIDKDGIVIKNKGEDLKTMILDLIGYVKKIIVVQGTGPDVAGLTQLETRFKKVFVS